MTPPCCRGCGATLRETFADLGLSPLSNAFIPADRAGDGEMFYPLHAWVCGHCRLVQLEAFETPAAMFSDYLYFSGFSDTWRHHVQAYAGQMIARLALGSASQVIEIASNDGTLLQPFRAAGVPVLGIDPAANVAAAAAARGIPTDIAFFGSATATRLRAAGHAPDLITANNVLAHVPDLHDFVSGLRILLPATGVITIEFPHLLRLLADCQFDTIYHEHFCYFSLHVAVRILARHGLLVFDVETLATHGGSLRVYACHDAAPHPVTAAVRACLDQELAAGLEGIEIYRDFAAQVVAVKCALLEFLIGARRAGRRVAGYGAPAKGNTLLNYCGVGRDLIDFTVDRNPHKQGLLLPGSRIPILAPEAIAAARPDYLLILPWNLRDEIIAQMAEIRSWGGQFVVPIPTLRVVA
jgi:predicted TPR repeat methyltransferase